jgi:hypothetical protein
MANDQRYRVFCNLPGPDGQPCGKEIASAPGMNVPAPGMSPDKNADALVQAVFKHLQKKHEGHASMLFGTWQQFFGYHCLGFLRLPTEDPKIMEFMAGFASQLRRLVCPPVSDSDIEQILGGIGFSMDDPLRAKTMQAFKNLRDLYTKPLSQSA